MEKQIGRCADDARRLQKTTECCKKARECIKESLITYSDGWGSLKGSRAQESR